MLDKTVDINMVKKVMTLKSGKFVFSAEYSPKKLNDLLAESRLLYQTVIDLPILPELASELEEELIRRSIFGTAAIEGNPLTEEQVGKILDAEEPAGFQRAEKEIRNLQLAYDLVKTSSRKSLPAKFDEEDIKSKHRMITEGLDYPDNIPGKYRDHIVKVGDREHGGVYTPPKIRLDIENLMKEFIGWINSSELTAMNPIIRAALAHYHLGLIHPFGDGNGRTARIMEALFMKQANIKYLPVMLSNYYYRNIDDYFRAFSQSIKSKDDEITPFLEFFLKGVRASLREIKTKIIYDIRILTLRKHYDSLKAAKEITQRQLDLLVMLLDKSRMDKSYAVKPDDLFNLSPFSVLYRKVVDRTAKRDLRKLTLKKLLIFSDGKYKLNISHLG